MAEPKFTINSTRDADKYKAYISQLLLDSVLKPMTDANKQNNLLKLTSPEAMKLWEAAVTHESLTADPEGNYQGFETLGDKTLGCVFTSWCFTNLPVNRRTPKYVTDLIRYWLSNEQLANFSRKLGLSNWVTASEEAAKAILPVHINDEERITHLHEDIFEAFFGVLMTVGDRFLPKGVGLMFAYNFFDWFLATNGFANKEEIFLPPEDVQPARSELDSMLQRVSLKLTYDRPRRLLDGKIQITITDPDEHVFAKGIGITKSAAENKAARNAINKLRDDPLYKEATKKRVDFDIENGKKVLNEFLTKQPDVTYSPVEFSLRAGASAGAIQQAELHTYQDGKYYILLGLGSGKTYGEARRAALGQALKTYGLSAPK